MISDYRHLQRRQVNHLLIAAGVVALSLLFSIFLSRRLQRFVSEPILQLAETARTVSETQDYTLRAEKLSTDEIGNLVDDFNIMLSQVQLRDHKLLQAKNHLEDKVKARTQELTELAQQLEHQAYHDTLTGLSNRVTFDDHLRLAIDQANRHQQKLAVMFLDLDRFKVINDTLGHGIGDKLLIEASQRLAKSLRKSDTLARLGGDEFAILLPQTLNADQAGEVARKIKAIIAEPFLIEGYSLHISASIGISLFPDDGDDAEIIVKNADTAMYRSKDNGRNQFTFFSADMNARAERRLMLETKLRAALNENRLTIHYQPRLDAETLTVIGVEALARWNDPEEGAISPNEFIPLAEECGLIAKVDEWVLESACKEILQWEKQTGSPLNVAVNLSPAQFIRDLGRDPDDEALVKTIITLAHNLNLKVVAEGVETEQQYHFVKQHACDTVQGYLFGKPAPGAEILKVGGFDFIKPEEY